MYMDERKWTIIAEMQLHILDVRQCQNRRKVFLKHCLFYCISVSKKYVFLYSFLLDTEISMLLDLIQCCYWFVAEICFNRTHKHHISRLVLTPGVFMLMPLLCVVTWSLNYTYSCVCAQEIPTTQEFSFSKEMGLQFQRSVPDLTFFQPCIRLSYAKQEAYFQTYLGISIQFIIPGCYC